MGQISSSSTVPSGKRPLSYPMAEKELAGPDYSKKNLIIELEISAWSKLDCPIELAVMGAYFWANSKKTF